jgi:large subunit ribosomal protein L24
MANAKLKIKKGDTVKLLSGKDRGKTGTVLRVIPASNRVVVENVNMHTRFERSKKAGTPGQKVVFAAAVHLSNVMLVDSNSGKPSRVGFKRMDNGSKIRIAKKRDKAV